MEIKRAQAEMRYSFIGGGPGVVVSGLVWLAAAVAAQRSSVPFAFTVMFLGGMMIFPVALVLVRGLFRRPAPGPDNRLGLIAIESTIAMLGGFFAAYLMLRLEPSLVFPLAAIAVGTHYFAFASIYGGKNFWVLGAVISAMGFLEAMAPGHLFIGLVMSVALVELGFGAFLTVTSLREPLPLPN